MNSASMALSFFPLKLPIPVLAPLLLKELGSYFFELIFIFGGRVL
jgi:hypothetical protein